jgi:hypothetical protein
MCSIWSPTGAEGRGVVEAVRDEAWAAAGPAIIDSSLLEIRHDQNSVVIARK